MVHPLDSEAWMELDSFDTDFASDARNIHFRLAIDGFDPFSINLPPSLCMKYKFMFLWLIILGSEAPST
jgi:hypothetical protein